jgi:hypothetical protein
VEPPDIAVARHVNPRAYLESLGHTVTGHDERGHLAVDHVLRADRQPDGHWVACDWHGHAIGDNLALVEHFEPHKEFAERVRTLTGARSISPVAVSPPARTARYPVLPLTQPGDPARGRAYLAERGIRAATIAAAEQAGVIRYGPNGVFFIGRDTTGLVRSATKRMLTPEPDPGHPGKTLAQRDLAHSDKRYPVVLPGEERSRTLHLVEGGMDALALHDLARERNKPLPTVIVTGGARVLRWLENPQIKTLLQTAEQVVVHREREKNPLVQKDTDQAHEKQVAAVRALRSQAAPDRVTTWMPPTGKDLAEYHQLLQRRPDSPAAEGVLSQTPPMETPAAAKKSVTGPPAATAIQAIHAGQPETLTRVSWIGQPRAVWLAVERHARQVHQRPWLTLERVLQERPAYQAAERAYRMAAAHYDSARTQRERFQQAHPIAAQLAQRGLGEGAIYFRRERETQAALAAATREFEKEQVLNQSPARQQQAAERVRQREAQRTAAATVLAQLGPLLAEHNEPRAQHQAPPRDHATVEAAAEAELS